MLKKAKEVPFGRAVAKITVTMLEEKKYLDGIATGNVEVITTQTIQIILNGKKIEEDTHAKVLEFNQLTDKIYRTNKLDVTKNYSKVGNKAMTLGEEAANAINLAIEEMIAELTKEIVTVTEKEQQDAIDNAKAVIEAAENEGIEKLMTDKQLVVWKKSYNNVVNEGYEGFIPIRISKEQYQKALQVLGGYYI